MLGLHPLSGAPISDLGGTAAAPAAGHYSRGRVVNAGGFGSGYTRGSIVNLCLLLAVIIVAGL